MSRIRPEMQKKIERILNSYKGSTFKEEDKFFVYEMIKTEIKVLDLDPVEYEYAIQQAADITGV